ncbi:SDR family oxidoreductase [Streptomyces huasconensis]|uniref:SDR family oxidoreductase n=1 Tax=Streptomyces huasconensis TaxID=1854574 RepID=UPI003702EC0C
MTIALTGGTGFVGSHLLAELLRRQQRVIALVRGDTDRARLRLRRAVAATGLGAGVLEYLDGVPLVQADLEQPHLGLGIKEFRRLARRIDTIWHCAAHIDLDATETAAHRVNVTGTRRILQLADACLRPPHVVYISTVFVAGCRPSGTVGEDDLDDSHGFVNSYERSKYATEVLIRDWASTRATKVTVLRPSVLVTSRPPVARGPRHPHAVVSSRLASHGPHWLARQAGQTLPAPGVLAARIAVGPQAVINVLPVEYAAAAMVRLASATHPGGTRTHHVVHPTDTPARACVLASAAHLPWLEVTPVPDLPDPTPAEKLLEQLASIAVGYRMTGRRYDRRTLDAADAAAGVTPPPPLTPAYLAATFDPGSVLSMPPAERMPTSTATPTAGTLICTTPKATPRENAVPPPRPIPGRRPVYEMLTRLLTEEFDIPAEGITPQATVRDLELDSLTLVELTVMVAEQTGKTIETEDLTLDSTLAEIADKFTTVPADVPTA